MDKKRLRIFVSSVGAMMDEERTILRELIWRNGHIPVAMEGFSGNHGQTSIDVMKDNLDHADVVIFVLGFTYGSIIGEGLGCVECPVQSCCDAKRNKTGNCSISYTHFEYLYAKHKNILSYCIVQENIENEKGFHKRLDVFISSKPDEEDINMQKRKKLLNDYEKGQKKYNKLISQVERQWFATYDANHSSGISSSIIQIFSHIQNRLIIDAADIDGLIDGDEVKKELREKNAQIERLNKEIKKLTQGTIDVFKGVLPVFNGSSTALTGTCIPFIYDKEENVITTYLVCNSAYSKGGRFMFPGGHAFVNEDSPEVAAIMKAKVEAGLDVWPIDLYSSYNHYSGEFSARFTICRPPHYNYLFVEDGSAKCYHEKRHLRHFDAAYVCEIQKIHPYTECSQERIAVKLPAKPLTLIQMKKIIKSTVEQYNMQNRKEATEEFCEDYIAKMLIDSHTDYLKYLKRQGKMQ